MASATVGAVYPTFPAIDHESLLGDVVLWITFVIFIFITLAFGFLTVNTPKHLRFFHYFMVLVALATTLAYGVMATGEGWYRWYYPVSRQFYYVRFAEWMVTTPLILLCLTVLAGVSGAEIVFTLIIDLVLINEAWMGAASYPSNSESKVKWGHYVICGVLYLCIVFLLLVSARRCANNRNERVGKLFTRLCIFAISVWSTYALVWAVCYEYRLFSVDVEIILFAFLDVLAKGVFGTWLLIMHNRIPECQVPIRGFWVYGIRSRGTRVENDTETEPLLNGTRENVVRPDASNVVTEVLG